MALKRVSEGYGKTVLGAKTVFDGVLRFKGNLHIRGKFSGAIDAQGCLTIAPGAVCAVQYARAVSIFVEGEVRGNLTVVDRVEMRDGSRVFGDVTASRIKICDGVTFEGSVCMTREGNVSKRDLFSVQSEQLKEHLRR
ncbi:bactofilin family protein [Treponema pallidum]|uniref:bactofilin family protein n=1 Tax=Treponema pallidum TaxID=160 RepID=UPI000B29E77B|nr:polymer-forming cytoskeletal protein [Treponema pallidum]